jgi:hypothetical protein
MEGKNMSQTLALCERGPEKVQLGYLRILMMRWKLILDIETEKYAQNEFC